jgi:general secretion pathway protein G
MRVALPIAALALTTLLRAGAYSPVYFRAEMRVAKASSAAHAFERDYGTFPPETNWLGELTASTNAVLNQNRVVYLQESDAKDPWGRNLVYRYPGKHHTGGVDVYSRGKDGHSASGGDDADDINNWNPALPWRSYYAGLEYSPRGLLMVSSGIVVVFGVFFIVKKRLKAQPGAPPNGGPAERIANSDAGGGPPSVS